MRVLLINDDDDALFLLSRSVRRAMPEAEVAQLRDSVAALDYYLKHSADAIVTDNTMPNMDGLTLARKIRERDQTVPILMVTNSLHLAEQAADAGITQYLPSARWSEVGPLVASLVQR